MMQLLKAAITTDASGDATVTFTVAKADRSAFLGGRIAGVRYVPDVSTPLATGASFVISGVTTGRKVLTQASLGTSAREWAPQQPTHALADGAAALYAAAGTAVNALIPVANESLKIVVASGGDTKSGTFYLWLDA